MVEAVSEVAFGGFERAAGAQAELLADRLDGLAERPGIGEGAEITRPILTTEAREFQAGDRILELNADQQESFVIAEADVVLGTPFLDQFALEEDRLGVAFDLMPLEVGRTVDQGAGLDLRFVTPRRREVVGEASAEVAGLADIDDL